MAWTDAARKAAAEMRKQKSMMLHMGKKQRGFMLNFAGMAMKKFEAKLKKRKLKLKTLSFVDAKTKTKVSGKSIVDRMASRHTRMF